MLRVRMLSMIAASSSMALITIPCASQELPFQLDTVETHVLESKILRQTFVISVQLPTRLKDGSERFPVLYVSDGQPGPTFEAENYFMQWGGDVPRYITVEIGYPSKAEWQLRNRNFTPTNTGPLAGYSDDLIDFGTISLDGVESGGAPELLEFIREELKPFINGNYPTMPGQDGYFGDSLGGLFGMFVLLNEPETFNKYILGSPSLWWDDGLLLEQAERQAEAGTPLDARLFMSVGGLESESMVSNMERAALLLANVDGLTIRTEVIPDESHMSVFPMNYIRGVKWAYESSEPHFLDAYRERHPEE